MRRNKVLFFIESLAGGGAEKVLSTLVKHIDQTRFDVTVYAICGGGKYEKEVADSVKYVSILKDSSSYSGIGNLWYALKYKLIYSWLPMWLVYRLFVPKDYDVEVAFVEGFATKVMAASANKKSKKIAWVHCDLKKKPWTIETGVYRSKEEEAECYSFFDKIICVSKATEVVMKDYYGLTNIETIYNPIDADIIKIQGNQPSPFLIDEKSFNIVSVGRLAPVKGFDILIPMVAQLRDEGKNVNLWIIGEGSERRTLEEQVAELGISEYITFTGFFKNPYSLMSRMDLFVCSSRAEGFSLAIAESLVLGVPVISMNCGGPKEILGDNEYGIICDNYENLYEEIVAMVSGNTVPCAIPPILNLEYSMNQIHKLLSD